MAHHPITSATCNRPGRKVESLVVEIGRDIRSRPERIAKFCIEAHRALFEDLATIAESIALADRVFSRQRSEAWARQIHLDIPVYEHDRLNRKSVLYSLQECLHFLTGDAWQISFHDRPGSIQSQAVLPLERLEYDTIIPYSDGLDSFAQSLILEAQGKRVLRIQSGRVGSGRHDAKPVLRVPRSLGPKLKREKTYRTRPFVFFTFAAIGSALSGAKEIVVGENGQGALGPALVPYAGEWPFRSTHPGFVSLFSSFIKAAADLSPIFGLPQVYKTKAIVLHEIAESNGLRGWEETRSCAVRPYSRRGSEACGYCGGCVLRAVATTSAGLHGRAATVLYPHDGYQEPDGEGEREIAVRAIGSMKELARLARDEQNFWKLSSEASLFGCFSAPDAVERMQTLLATHAEEWNLYLNSLPSRSWLRQLADQL